MSASVAFAAPQSNRIARNASFSEKTELPASAGSHRTSVASLGALDRGTELTSVSLVLKPSAAQDADLNQLLADQQNPSSPSFHKWLTPAEFGTRFGVSDSDLSVLQQWLTSQGLQVNSVSPSRNLITFSGTASAIQDAFGTQLQRYRRDGRQYFENATNLHVPSAFAAVVGGVRGLSSFRLQPHVKIVARPQAAQTTIQSPDYTSTGGSGHYVVPWDFRQIYGINPLINSGSNGTGVKIAVIGQSAVDTQQLTFFQQLTGQTVKLPTMVLVPFSGTSTAVTGDEGESEVDLEYASGSAPGASVYFVYTGNAQNKGVLDALTYAVQNNIAPILTISYGGCEADNALYGALSLEQTLRQANAQGETVLASSGDNNAAGCEATRIGAVTTATQGKTVSYPASSAYVVGVGGTRFSEGTGSYWSATNNVQSGSALGYIPEVVWNDTTVGGDLSGTGGGASALFGKPSWQSGTGVPNDGARDVPDVAFSSSNAHDGYLFCSAEATAEKCTASAWNQFVIGGTSLAAPNFAAMLAVVASKIGNTTGYGDLNPALYTIFRGASGGSVFHDVTSGNNNVACQVGSLDCTSGTFGYSAGVGYDQTTGLGSIDAGAFATAYAALTSAASAPAVVVTVSPAQALANQSTALKAQVSGTGASAPTGTVTFAVDGGAQSSPVTLSPESPADKSAAAVLSVSGYSAGTHNVVATYSGDSAYSGATATFTFVVVNPLTGQFTISASPSTLTIQNGASGSESVSATSVSGFSDQLNYQLYLRGISQLPSGVTVCYDSTAKALPANSTSTTSIAIYTSASACQTSGSQHTLLPSAQVSRTGKSSSRNTGMAVLAMLMIGGIGLRGSRKTRGLLIAFLISVSAIAAIGCGSGGSAATSGGSGSGSSGSTGSTVTVPLTAVAFSSRDQTKTATSDFTLVIQK